jgi:hypothetical protein
MGPKMVTIERERQLHEREAITCITNSQQQITQWENSTIFCRRGASKNSLHVTTHEEGVTHEKTLT